MRYFVIAIIILILNIVAIAVVYFFIDHEITKKGMQILQVEHDINDFGAAGQEVDGLLASKKSAQNRFGSLNYIGKSTRNARDLLAAIARSIPKQAWLTELNKRQQSLVLSGYAMSERDVAVFIGALQSTALFSKISLSATQPQNIKGVNVIRFQLSCVLGGAT